MPAPAEPGPSAWQPAGFWQRTAAWTLDAALLLPLALWCSRGALEAAQAQRQAVISALNDAMQRPLQWMLDGASPTEAALRMYADPALRQAAAVVETAFIQSVAVPVLVFAALALLWHVGFERSAWRGSPGKRLLGLQVADAQGGPPALVRSLLRFFAGGVSWLTFNLGHAMAALPPRHQALHDLLSGTRVNARSARLPAWALAWLWLLAAGFVVANAWLLHQMEAALRAALLG